ncbi:MULTISPECIES: flavin reductase family protein [Gordonia]|uniref:Flavin reductase n=2 Tax=Gordonia terrae TaxID=2055 RepID=A0AAD0KAZ3_9ACTN|nr:MULTISPECIES: flavin reductase family protein [Gordonia]VTR10518.1 FMN-binding flavin reductase-like protein [Clostridioides difficile]ANY24140.1 flavin reductase [Gordonia terrae]AWO84883.1 flavin reductase [Gordonia terrae]MCG7633597.1 flavin reductase family protein [Gordonia sp. McavH-238-E]UPW07552.1 flavin reductase family protein [Gordonia terrae]
MIAQQVDDLTARFRDAMATVCTPVAVVTAMDGQRPHGTTVSAFASLSMTPPSLLVSLDRGSELLGLVLDAGVFGMNVLGSTQSRLAGQFARKGADKFDGVSWRVDAGVPRIADVPHWLAAEVMHTAEVADHIVVFGRVVDVASETIAPLTYHARSFGTHAALPPAGTTNGVKRA